MPSNVQHAIQNGRRTCIAGGPSALTRAIEGMEDSPERGATDIALLDVSKTDLVVGITTSGRTPYVLGAVREARRRDATTIGIACNRPSLLGPEVDLEIAPVVGPEIISGSTRLQSRDCDQDDLEHDIHRRNGADRQDAG